MKPSQPFFEVRNLSKTYTQDVWLSGRRFPIKALDDVSLAVRKGSTFALVGASGSGKSTLAKCLVSLEVPDSGSIWFEGRSLFPADRAHLKNTHWRLQLIFQDAATAFNPTFSVLEIIMEPLVIQGRGVREERRRRALDLMQQVELPVAAASRSPFELSGGERQRLAIARALAIEPKVLVLDEALSGLDLPIQKQIVRLLLEIQSRTSLTYLLISHDLGLVADIADHAAVMYEGRIVEEGVPLDLFSKPEHAHTQALVAAAPVLEHCSAAEET
jgi:peptide/nickel transport system ATP-binding protein